MAFKKKEIEKEVEEVKVEKKKEKTIEFTQADWDEYMRSGNTLGIVKSFPDWLAERK